MQRTNVILYVVDWTGVIHEIGAVALKHFHKMKLFFYCRQQPSLFPETLYAMGKPAVTGQKSISKEMAHKHYALPEAKKKNVWQEMTGRCGRFCFLLFFFLLAFHFVTSPSVGTQALVRQGEQSHVIGFFPI